MEKILSFYIGSSVFGVDIKNVKEINRNIEFTHVPDSNKNIMGLYNMRGHIVTIFDLYKAMGMNEKVDFKNSCIILKSTLANDNCAGFFVDKFGDVIDMNKENCVHPPTNITDLNDEYIDCVLKVKNELIVVINSDKIFK